MNTYMCDNPDMSPVIQFLCLCAVLCDLDAEISNYFE